MITNSFTRQTVTHPTDFPVTAPPPGGLSAARPACRCIESLLSLSRMHWEHEPTPNPSQEGNGQDADRRLFHSWEGSGVGRFMERAGTASGALFLPPRIFQKV